MADTVVETKELDATPVEKEVVPEVPEKEKVEEKKDEAHTNGKAKEEKVQNGTTEKTEENGETNGDSKPESEEVPSAGTKRKSEISESAEVTKTDAASPEKKAKLDVATEATPEATA